MWRFVSLGCAVIAALAVTFASTGSQTHAASAGTIGSASSTVNPSNLSSRNWAGYVVRPTSAATTFRTVTATWTQPAIHCNEPNAWAVFWVGLDGWTNTTVEQGGSSAKCVSGTPIYTLWWEMYPTGQITSVFVINPGDSITATVSFAASQYLITVSDTTSGQTFTKHATCASNLACSRRSAEVVAEDPGLPQSTALYPLANYQSVTFNRVSASDSLGHTGSLTSARWQTAALTEKSAGETLASPSTVTANGSQFHAKWLHK